MLFSPSRLFARRGLPSRLRTLLALLLFLESATVLRAYQANVPIQTVDKSGVKISLHFPLKDLRNGFLPVRVHIENGTDSAHAWQYTFTVKANGRDEASGEIEVPARSVRDVDLLIPRNRVVAEDQYVNAYVRFSGHAVNGSEVSINSSSSYGSGDQTAYIAMSESLSSTWGMLETWLKTASIGAPSRAPMTKPRSLLGSQVNLAEMPADSRAFFGIAGLWLTLGEWQQLPMEKRAAIREAVDAGCRLFIVCDALPAPPISDLPQLSKFNEPALSGFGMVTFVQSESGKLVTADVLPDIEKLDGVLLPPQRNKAEARSPLVDRLGTPRLNAFLLIGFLVVFAVVAGPVNVLWIAPANRRYRLFFSVPLISIAASVLIGLLIVFGDGFGGIGGRNVLLYLSPENRAVAVQEQASRTSLLFNRTFQVPLETEISGSPISPRGNDKSISLDRDGLNLSGDWFRSRSVQEQFLRAAFPSRASVQLQTGGDGKLTLLSNCPGALHHLFYIDREGKYWQIPELLPGRPEILKESSQKALDDFLIEASKDFNQNMKELLDTVEHRPGHFYALMDPMPGAPIETLTSIRWNIQSIICFGPCGGEEVK